MSLVLGAYRGWCPSEITGLLLSNSCSEVQVDSVGPDLLMSSPRFWVVRRRPL